MSCFYGLIAKLAFRGGMFKRAPQFYHVCVLAGEEAVASSPGVDELGRVQRPPFNFAETLLTLPAKPAGRSGSQVLRRRGRPNLWAVTRHMKSHRIWKEIRRPSILRSNGLRQMERQVGGQPAQDRSMGG